MAKQKKKPKILPFAQEQMNVVTSDNDNLSEALKDLVPEKHKGTDKFLDVVQWNLEWFGATKSRAKDKLRYDTILTVLEALNADLFVFQEIAGPSKDGRYPGALDAVADDLVARDAGDYRVAYSDAGGEQRIAMMWDRDWLRARAEIEDLYDVGEHKTKDGKDAFARRSPLYGYFASRLPASGTEDQRYGSDSFDFQVLGLHLKAMEDGHEQRLKSADVLAGWLSKEAPTIDADVIMVGDWNAPPNDACWKPIHDLEKKPNPDVHFSDINDPDEFSYLWLRNKSTKFVSRIDLAAISSASMRKAVDGEASKVILWKPIEEALKIAGDLTDKEVVNVLSIIKEHVSDHLPTVTRFYFTDQDPVPARQ